MSTNLWDELCQITTQRKYIHWHFVPVPLASIWLCLFRIQSILKTRCKMHYVIGLHCGKCARLFRCILRILSESPQHPGIFVILHSFVLVRRVQTTYYILAKPVRIASVLSGFVYNLWKGIKRRRNVPFFASILYRIEVALGVRVSKLLRLWKYCVLAYAIRFRALQIILEWSRYSCSTMTPISSLPKITPRLSAAQFCRADLKQEQFVLSDSSAASLRGAKARLPSKTATTKFKSMGIIHATATLNDFKSTARQLKPTGTTQSQSAQWQCWYTDLITNHAHSMLQPHGCLTPRKKKKRFTVVAHDYL